MRGLRVDPKRMRANLDLGGGLIMAEAVMLDLGAAIGRQHAHDVVYDAAQAAFVEGKSFSDLLAADTRLTAHMDKKAIGKLLDPTAYTGLCADMARESVTRAREAAAGAEGAHRKDLICEGRNRTAIQAVAARIVSSSRTPLPTLSRMVCEEQESQSL